MTVHLKRIYEPKAETDGLRVLVDRIWPRGVSKKEAGVDLWLKDIAPSTELRRWFGHDAGKWAEFRRRYEAELKENPGEVAALLERAAGKKLTLLYAAADTEHNNAVVLGDFLSKQRSG